MKRLNPIPRLSLFAVLFLLAIGSLIAPTPLLAADSFTGALTTWKARYDEAVRKAEKTAATADPDAVAELRSRLGNLAQKHSRLEQLALKLRDLQSQIDSLTSREDFLRNDWESAQRQYKWLLKQYKEKLAQVNQELKERGRQTAEHNARQGTSKDQASVDAYNAEADRLDAWRDRLVSKKQEVKNQEGKQVKEAKQIVQKRRKEYEENKAKKEALKKQQGPQARKFQALLNDSSRALARLPQGLGIGTIRRQVTELAAPRPAPSSASSPTLNFVPLTPFRRGSPENPPLLPLDQTETVKPGMNTKAMDQLKSTASHGAKAKNSARQGKRDPLKLDEASQQARRGFDTPGRYAGSLDPMVVDGRGYGARNPVVPKEKRTPTTVALEKKRDAEKQQWQKLEKKVAELGKLSRTPERNVEIVKAREEADKAKNKMRFQNFMIQVALDEAPGVPAAGKKSSTVPPPPPVPAKPNSGRKSSP